jgi:hypothetical protein
MIEKSGARGQGQGASGASFVIPEGFKLQQSPDEINWSDVHGDHAAERFVRLSAIQLNPTNNAIKSHVETGFYDRSTGAGSLALVDSDCEIHLHGGIRESQSIGASEIDAVTVRCGNLADRSGPTGKHTRAFNGSRRGLIRIPSRLTGILAMPVFFANWCVSRFTGVIWKRITPVFAADVTTAARVPSQSDSTPAGKPVGVFFGQGCSQLPDRRVNAVDRLNPSASFSLDDAGFPPRAGENANSPRHSFSRSEIHMSFAKALGFLVGFASLVILLALVGCQSHPARDQSLGKAQGDSSSLDGTFDTIRYEAEQAKKEIK